jgi:hypothetical protein
VHPPHVFIYPLSFRLSISPLSPFGFSRNAKLFVFPICHQAEVERSLQTMEVSRCKPNKDLTPKEKKARRELKKQLKNQQRRARLETKLRHAIQRNDARTEEETRVALEAFNQRNSTKTSSAIQPLEEETVERKLLLQICSELQRKQYPHNKDQKQSQTKQAVTLLRHMTKGSQEKSMFKDLDALWGYARQKFFERAMLVCTSFLKLRESPAFEELWDRLRSIRHICSIGCGPGNDAMGVVAFLKATSSPNLERAVLMDWALEDWKAILEPLKDIIVPTYVSNVGMSSCDVAKSLLDSYVNQHAKQLIINQPMDLFLISYLLTEVRGKWLDFVKDMIEISRPNTLYYFAEPTPWQLHNLRNHFSHELDFYWLDSSMDQPHLQPLDNRVGPGVLLGRKR